jgi:hypothetical protein
MAFFLNRPLPANAFTPDLLCRIARSAERLRSRHPNARIFFGVRDFEHVLVLYRCKGRRIFSRTVTDHNSFTDRVIARRVS